jgi:hypothetical protein
MVKFKLLGFAVFLGVQSFAVLAADVLTEFKAGDRVKAAEMNANFSTLESRLDTLNKSVTFDGLDDIYSGTAETEAGGEASGLSVQAGVYGAELKRFNTTASTTNTPCT